MLLQPQCPGVEWSLWTRVTWGTCHMSTPGWLPGMLLSPGITATQLCWGVGGGESYSLQIHVHATQETTSVKRKATHSQSCKLTLTTWVEADTKVCKEATFQAKQAAYKAVVRQQLSRSWCAPYVQAMQQSVYCAHMLLCCTSAIQNHLSRPHAVRWQGHLVAACCRSNAAEAGLLKQLFAKYAAPAVDYVLEGVDAGELVQKLKLSIPVTNLNLITQLCHLLETLLLDSGHYIDPNVSACTPTSLIRDTDVLDKSCMTSAGNAAACRHDHSYAAEQKDACRF
jgi:hypothetical protein